MTPAPTAGSALLPDLVKPSLGVIRARLIAEQLSAAGAAGPALPRVAATGKTHTGKSTLGNLLLGADDVLLSTGHRDCTDAVCRLSFARGLTYVDLPGVASDDRLENYNRIALGLPVRADLELPQEIQVIDYDASEQSNEQRYPAADLPAETVAPDVILYLNAPHQQVNREEEIYLRDLVRRYGSRRVLLVLNLHHDLDGNRLATEQNIADARARLSACYQADSVPLGDQDVVTVDCKAGTGLPELLTAMRRPLGDDQAAPLADVIAYQAGHAPGTFRDEVHQAVAAYAAGLAAITPASDAAAITAATAATGVLAAYAGQLSGGATVAVATSQPFKALAGRVAAELRIEHTEPVFREVSKPVYRKEPIYTEREETDYSRPIKRSVSRRRRRAPQDLDDFLTSVGNLFGGDGFGIYYTSYEEETVGYEKKWVSKITGYRDELDHTETYRVQDGTRKILAGYRPLGARGSALTLTGWYLALRQAGGIPGGNADAVYRQILKDVNASNTPGADWLPPDAGHLLDTVIARSAGR